MEKEIIEKIKKEMNKIKELSCYDMPFFKLDTHVNQILKYLEELIDSANNEKIKEQYFSIYNRLDYANNRYVMFAKEAHMKANKKNALEIRTVEFCNSFKTAIRQIDIELSYFTNLA